MLELAVVILAGFAGGLLNAVAGGGSFFTLPALMFAGLPPVLANATGTAALLPGYLASAWRFRRDLAFPSGMSLTSAVLLALLGGSLGAGILLVSSQALFRTLIPWLVLLATLLFVAGPGLLRRIRGRAETASPARWTVVTVLVLVCIYGGYFNGGMGVLLLAALGLLGQTDLRGMNGAKNLLSAVLTAIAVLVYALGGLIALEHVWVMAVAAIAGGHAGAALAYRLSQAMLRLIVTGSGLLLWAAFLWLET